MILPTCIYRLLSVQFLCFVFLLRFFFLHVLTWWGLSSSKTFSRLFFSTFEMDKFGKIRRQHWKERHKISKVAKLECNLLKTNEDTAPQSGAKFQRRFVWWWGTNLSPTIQTSVNFRNFAALYLPSLKTYHFQVWQFY